MSNSTIALAPIKENTWVFNRLSTVLVWPGATSDHARLPDERNAFGGAAIGHGLVGVYAMASCCLISKYLRRASPRPTSLALATHVIQLNPKTKKPAKRRVFREFQRF